MSEKKQLLREGDVIELGPHKVYAEIPQHFVYDNRPGCWDLARTEIRLDDPKWLPLAGKYIVIRTSHGGGGTGHGPHDVYPDGHSVTCRNTAIPHFTVSFFQTGSFTAMIRPGEVEIVGKAEQQWMLADE